MNVNEVKCCDRKIIFMFKLEAYPKDVRYTLSYLLILTASLLNLLEIYVNG